MHELLHDVHTLNGVATKLVMPAERMRIDDLFSQLLDADLVVVVIVVVCHGVSDTVADQTNVRIEELRSGLLLHLR